MKDFTEESRVFLSTLWPERRQRRMAFAAMLVSAVVFVLLLPFAKTQLPQVWAFIPVYESAIVITDLITAILLLGQFNVLRTRAALVLPGGYLFTASMGVAHMLSFPGLFAPAGLLDANPQTTAWLYMFWHAGFPLCVLAYAGFEQMDRARERHFSRSGPPIAGCVALAFAAACGLTFVAVRGIGLPQLMAPGHGYTSAMPWVVSAVWALSAIAFGVLALGRASSVLRLWLMVVTAAWVFDIALSAVFNHGRFDLGFYAGRLYGLVAASFVLVALLFENAKLYARVVHALAGEMIERRRVQEKTAQLNDANALLERRVLERTSALRAANADLSREVAARRRVEAALERSYDELREIAAISATAREQEKRRIARELHDELAQTLAMLKIELGRAAAYAPADDAAAQALIGSMARHLDDAIASIRRIAADLRPAMLDDLGLVPACSWLLENFRQRYGIPCTFVCEPSQFELDEPYASTVYRILQESLANVARHAQATQVEVRLVHDGDSVHLTVRDNGVGFDSSAPRKENSFGLVGLRERASLVQGALRIESLPDIGTTIDVSVPLADTDPDCASAHAAGPDDANHTNDADNADDKRARLAGDA